MESPEAKAPGAAPDAALARAAHWFERVQNEDLEPEEVDRWQRWMAADPAHREAFERCRDLWARLDEIPIPRLPTAAELASDRPAASRLWRFAIAASIAALLLACLQISRWSAPQRMIAFETAASEHRKATLPDGSGLALGAKSLLVLHYARERRVVVLERGEAFFEVARDRSRPFVVRTGETVITALGTAFNVRNSGTRVTVAVSAGAVEVRDSRRGIDRRVESGQQVVIEPSQPVSRVQAVSPETATAWREGRLQYRGEPLKYVLEDVSRYSSESVTLGDAAAGDLLVTGTVFESDVDAWLESLEEILPVQVDRQGDVRIVKMRRK